MKKASYTRGERAERGRQEGGVRSHVDRTSHQPPAATTSHGSGVADGQVGGYLFLTGQVGQIDALQLSCLAEVPPEGLALRDPRIVHLLPKPPPTTNDLVVG
jgi:hypothetical protein